MAAAPSVSSTTQGWRATTSCLASVSDLICLRAKPDAPLWAPFYREHQKDFSVQLLYSFDNLLLQTVIGKLLGLFLGFLLLFLLLMCG